jgi:hypothetical protein
MVQRTGHHGPIIKKEEAAEVPPFYIWAVSGDELAAFHAQESSSRGFAGAWLPFRGMAQPMVRRNGVHTAAPMTPPQNEGQEI